MVILRKILLICSVISISILSISCSSLAKAKYLTQVPGSFPEQSTAKLSPTPFQAMTNTPIIIPPTFTPSSTFTPTSTYTPQFTDTPTPTDTPVPTETPAYVWNPAGDVIAPILLYHHVSDEGYGNRYYGTIDDFRAQMQALSDWGYTSITVSDMVDVLINGGDLPVRPVVITFDDGNTDVYDNAFPIMQEFGFVGTFYIVANRLEARDFVDSDQLREMANAGWEIGSHSMSHLDLTLNYAYLGYEVRQSKLDLEGATGVSVTTFAYPYGLTDETVTNKVSESGYIAGMGLGRGFEHTLWSLFYLSRIEVQGGYDLSVFASLLPWSGY